MLHAKNLPLDKEAIIDKIKTWVAIESPTYEVAAVEKMLDCVESELKQLPFTITRTKPVDRFAGILKAQYGKQNTKGILVLCHIDTVHPLGTINTLPIKIDGDKFYGPGLYDMKGGAYIALHAFKTLMGHNIKPHLPITFIFTPDEEVGSLSSRPLIEEEARKAAFVLVTEPARDGGKLVTARKGVGRYILKATGIPAHSGAYHQDGRSAIKELAHQILAIEALTDYERGITATVGMIRGGTAANVIPREAFADIDIRVPTLELAEEVEAKLFALKPVIDGVEIEITGALNRPPFAKDEGGAGLFNRARHIAEQMGYTLEDMATGGGSDGNFTAALGVPTLDGLGIDGKGAHTLNEHGLISSIEKQCRIMMGLLETLR